ncbi:hypothetical protein FJ960_26080 [Mesorhizobium sp. B2-3-11]|uniref:hypothetical protein n=1 Tax=Mesorhizobium sp. B2-3-11 TaxID=2589953 RepID=UPI00112D0719|nr:hypothetical protein [Mesorhizobium sp. B2-3-11]TPL96409.1 hypothetical protein FJ960_26080 [Mesorhizobium sp. B2-3-11]
MAGIIVVDKELIGELAKDFDLDVDRLHAATLEALHAYRFERDFWAWREGATHSVAHIVPVLGAVQKAAELWSGLPAEARAEVSYFLDMDRSSDPIGPKFDFIISLLDEYHLHYNRARGNPGRSRSGSGLSLRPLRAFAEIMMQFWVSEKKAPFGNVVERHVELPTKKGVKAPRSAKSEGIDFLNAAGIFLHPDQYLIENFETVVSRIKRTLSAGPET